MLGILEFTKIRHCGIPSLRAKRSNLIKSPSLRGVSETNDEAISFIKPFFDGILNEIASVALLPRNDGILDGILMRSSGQARG